ncbi:MAG TPA: histidine phosphatase family protein [Puia sp.]
MKTLILVRHAKSSHSFGLSSDFDRPLNDRGFREAADMGKKLFKKKILIDQFVSSPAARAKTTAELIVAEYGRKLKEILYIPTLYNAAQENFIEVIQKLDDTHSHVALFSHNPGITDFASSLTNTHISHMPTCSVFAVTSPIDYWKDFAKAEKSYLFFYKPE